MIKILKINSEKMQHYTDSVRNHIASVTYKPDADVSCLYLNHDAYRINLIRSDGTTHTVKIAGEIFKLKTPQLFSILIKVYNRRFINFFAKSEEELYVNDIYDFVFSSLNPTSSDDRWTFLFHKDTFDLLERIFPNRSSDMIALHLNNKIDFYLNKRSEKAIKELKGLVYWNLYKVMNTRKDLGINFTINSKEFSALSKLFVLDFMYETVMNEESLLDSSILYSSSAINERMEQVILLLDSIGKFALNFSKFNTVLITMTSCLPRFGLPTYLANNLLEEKYLKNNVSNNIGFNYVDAIWEKRYEVINKIKEFISFHDGAASYPFGENFINGQGVSTVVTSTINACPEPAIEIEPGQVDVQRDDYNNVSFVGMNVDYNNMYVILFRDLMLAFTGIKERWNTAKNASAEDMNKDLIVKDLKDLYNRVLDARYRLRGGNPDTIDLDSLEDQILTLTSEVQNYNIHGQLGEALGLGEEFKIPGFIKNFINDKKEEVKARIGRGVENVKDNIKFSIDSKRKKAKQGMHKLKQNFIIDLMKVLDSIPSIGILPSPSDFTSKIESHYMQKAWKKKDREAEKAEWKEQLGRRKDHSSGIDYHDAKKDYFKPKRDRVGGRESFYGYFTMKGYTTDELFNYETIHGYSEGVKEFVGDKITIFILNGILKRVSGEKGLSTTNDQKKEIKEKLKNISNRAKNPKIEELCKKIYEELNKLDNTSNNNSNDSSKNKTVGIKETFSLMDEASKRNFVLNTVSNIDSILNKVNPDNRIKVIKNFAEAFDGYLSQKQFSILQRKFDDSKKQINPYGEKYEENNGILELYGPEERAFREPKDVVALCYRLIWNLKNTGKVNSFNEISKISLSSVNSKLYALITTTKGNYLFDLSKVYSDIPNTLSNKDIDVSPEDHKIQVLVNRESGLISSTINKTNSSSNNPDDKDAKKDENVQEVTSEVIEEKVIGNDNLDEEEKQEVLGEFEENLVDKLEKSGLSIQEEDEG